MSPRTDPKLERARDLIAMRSPVALATRFDRTYGRRAHADLISGAVMKCASGEENRVLITLPPQSGKSTTAAVWGSFWWLIHNPSHRIMVASYAASLAIDRGKAVRELVREHGHRYGLKLRAGSAAAENWYLTTGGGMRCFGVDGGATGFGANVVIGDDLIKGRKDAESVRVREDVDKFWSSSLVTRLAPRAPMILIMTLWHPDDIGGRVIKREGDRATGGRWHVLKMPAFASSEQDPLGREVGEPLPHPLIPDGDTEALKEHWNGARSTVSAQDWGAMYQCDPKPREGALITAEVLAERRVLTNRPAPVIVAVAVDPSGGGKDTAGIIGGYLGADGRVVITDDETAVMPVEKWTRVACELAARTKAHRFVVETDFGARMGLALIRTAWDALAREWEEEHAVPGRPPGKAGSWTAGNPYARPCPRLVKKRAREMGPKLVRAEPVAQQIIEGRVVFGSYMPELEDEWATVQAGRESPGRVDASVWLVYDLQLPPATGPGVTTPPSDVDRREVQRNPTDTTSIHGRRIIRPGQ